MKRKKSLEKLTGILKFVLEEYDNARIMTNAATITLFMFISIFPLLMVLMTLIPLFPFEFSDLLELIKPWVPEGVFPVIQGVLEEMYEKTMDGSALSITIVLTMWTASSGISWLARGINDVYRKKERRIWIKHRLMSLLYTLIFVVVIIVTLLCSVFGHNIQQFLTARFPGMEQWGERIRFLRNLVTLVVVDIFVTLIYQVFPRNKRFFLHQLPGAVFATAGWYGFSAVYSFYLKSISNYSYIYGSLAAIVSAVIWLFVCMNIILLGGEVNYLWEQFVLDKWQRKRQERKKQQEKKPPVMEIPAKKSRK